MRRQSLEASLAAVLAAIFVASAATAGLAADESDRAGNEPLQIFISLDKQQLQVYRGTEVIATSRVSSGRPGRRTPTGIFSILEKQRYHRSNLYSSAPMPWMQRITWGGVAMHESNSVPNYPASHGCVRLPGASARKLYGMTSVGQMVVISHDPLAPEPIVDAALPQPAMPAPYDPLKDHWRVLVENAGVTLTKNFAPKISTAALLYPVRDRIGFDRKPSGAPIRILITRRSHQDITADVQKLLNRLGYEAGPVDGLVGPSTAAAVKAFQADHAQAETGVITPEFTRALYAAADRTEPANASIFVRRKFDMVLKAPVTIDDPEQPLGTHLITATNYDTDAMKTDWLAVTMENHLPRLTRAYFNIDEDAPTDTTAKQALDRIHIPQDVALRIARMLTPGSSITISDTGLSQTGWKTDFRVFTRSGKSA